MATIRVGDIGTVLTLTVKDEEGAALPLAGALAELSFQRPNCSIVTVPATIVGDGSTGQVTYTTDGGPIFDVSGRWTLQVQLTFSPALLWHSTPTSIEVGKNVPMC